jgi:hypothetical protein
MLIDIKKYIHSFFNLQKFSDVLCDILLKKNIIFVKIFKRIVVKYTKIKLTNVLFSSKFYFLSLWFSIKTQIWSLIKAIMCDVWIDNNVRSWINKELQHLSFNKLRQSRNKRPNYNLKPNHNCQCVLCLQNLALTSHIKNLKCKKKGLKLKSKNS